ncbi:MAG: hypothetical protein ACM32E_12930 [Gemmatimonadota bacterium]
MQRRINRARLAAVLAAVALLAGCKVVVTAPPPSAGGQPAAASGQPAAPGGTTASGKLTAVPDEGQVTYSVHLTHCHAGDGGQLPDPHCTPGSVDPAITQADIGRTICRSGYTAKVRPPSSETGKAKYDVAYPAYGIPSRDASELDHLVSLELGGSNDITNLWPEVGSLPNPKDKVENALHRAVCDGRVSLRAAQQAIASDWMTAEAKLGLG